MTQLSYPMASNPMPKDRATAREILLMHASALIARQVREQFWTRTAVTGLVVFAIAGLGHLAATLGYLGPRALPMSTLIVASQVVAILAFLATATLFLAGRQRMIRSEVDLLRLRIEMLSEDSTEDMSEDAVDEKAPERRDTAAATRVKRPRRRINLRSSD